MQVQDVGQWLVFCNKSAPVESVKSQFRLVHSLQKIYPAFLKAQSRQEARQWQTFQPTHTKSRMAVKRVASAGQLDHLHIVNKY
jgi:hypothetical protein